MATGSETTVPHPEAIHHFPPFITMPGKTDWFLVGTGIFLILAVIGIGVFYLKLHALPEHMAHSGQKVQFEIVAVLALIALFTHNHAFWIAGLLLAMIPLPDFSTPLESMASSLGRMARSQSPVVPDPPVADPVPSPATES
jgi:hypothetical protein